MKRFSTFLFEAQWKRDHDALGRGTVYFHDASVGNHLINVEARKHPSKRHYDLEFTVNGSYSNAPHQHSPEEGAKIGLHVMKALHSFVKQKKPEALHWSPADMSDDETIRKHNFYSRIAKKLVRKHGGHLSPHGESWYANAVKEPGA